jgi:DNA-damage-inducible protein D
MNSTIFEEIKHINPRSGVEYWYARELMPKLGYKRWENFETAIKRAKKNLTSTGMEPSDHFRDLTKVIEAGKGAKMQVSDVAITRYGCYILVQNGDPSKEEIAAAQSYFAIQTRRQEIADEKLKLTEDQLRLQIRRDIREHNTALADAAHNAGVLTDLDYAIFQNEGYKGLYGGLDAKAIHSRKGLKKSQKILDYMGSTELAANLFRATQAEDKIRRENIQGKGNANKAHNEVGKVVRDTISKLGGDMPENLPTPDKGISQIERAEKKRLANADNNNVNKGE